MSLITLVRHGQANSTARDETAYDQLSPLGRRQARWLGDHMRGGGETFARVWTGTLRRQVETAEGIGEVCAGAPRRDPRLNELEYFTLSRLMEEQHGIPLPASREGFVRHLPTLFHYWQQDRLEGAPERFAEFEARVEDVLAELAAAPGRSLVVTSGGLIGMALRVTMRLDLEALSHVCLSVQNSSVSRWLPIGGGLALTQFNATPHLDTAERRFAQTHI